ncbi:MAG: hypothetical protein JXK94_08440 [Deltaproteobacteria bacterium]|nr:hypothetical protein [Deltaproteobacteria bacterium]
MKTPQVTLDFQSFVLEGELFDTEIARKLVETLPLDVSLTRWGSELYGPIGVDLGEENPVDEIPPGGIAYTRDGCYVCIFFGQRPAWAVEHIGRITDKQWKRLAEATCSSVKIRTK